MSAACTLAAPGGAHLLPSSADPRGSDSSGPAPWDQASIDAVVDAAEMEDWGVVADALEDGFPINTGHSQTGYTALHHAAFYADLAAVQLALSCGADPRVRSDNGRTAVCYAARHGSAEVMAMLLAAKGDVNTVACCGRTPLIVLCLAGYGDAPARLRLLLDQPHLNLAVTFEGRGPAEWAREGGREDLAVMVEEEVSRVPFPPLCGGSTQSQRPEARAGAVCAAPAPPPSPSRLLQKLCTPLLPTLIL
jgi:hypothetical protein